MRANVSPVFMIVAYVAAPKSPKMKFIERNDMVEQFATRCPPNVPPFRFARGSECSCGWAGDHWISKSPERHFRTWHHGRTQRNDKDRGAGMLPGVVAQSNRLLDGT